MQLLEKEKQEPQKKDTFTVILVGAILASVGGLIKYILSWNYEWAVFGILLPFYFCLITPIIGGILGWIGSFLGYGISNSRFAFFAGGVCGGVLTTMVLLPAPLIIY